MYTWFELTSLVVIGTDHHKPTIIDLDEKNLRMFDKKNNNKNISPLYIYN
jgi:hypothetical protein